jgi:PIN domain nuclease of toxin-antitoxin system
VILLDTHIWIWWIGETNELSDKQRRILQVHAPAGLGVSIISCWEVAKLVELGRLALALSVEEWIEQALAYPEIHLLDLTPKIAVESTQLPGTFHRDPADQIIVATSRILNIPLLTVDSKIRNYPHIKLATLNGSE